MVKNCHFKNLNNEYVEQLIMECSVLKSCSTKQSLGIKLHKSSRRRRRNKCKNFSLTFRKNYRKANNASNMTNNYSFNKSKKSQAYESYDFSTKYASDWYWSNYNKALEWHNKHKIAHWKARALALQEENRYLLQIIQSIQPEICSKLSLTNKNLSQKSNNKSQKKGKPSEKIPSKNSDLKNVNNNANVEDDEDIQFEMSEEMIKFFEQSIKHKMDLKKQKEEKELQLNSNEQVKQLQLSRLKRLEEMKLLYGDESSMIIGMETAVQLSFERYCDTKSPKYWPNIPLRL